MQDLRKRSLTVALPIEQEGEEAMGIEDLVLWQMLLKGWIIRTASQ